MIIVPTSLDGLVVVKLDPFIDQRGLFSRLFCTNELSKILGSRIIKQVNYSKTHLIGTVRGMHMQLSPHAEMKIITCLQGSVFDVAVDCRKYSPTFLQWYGIELTAVNNKMLIIPEGFAHGFQVLASNSELLYLHTDFYTPAAEFGIHPADPTIGVHWPCPISAISDRDATLPNVHKEFTGYCP